MHLIQAPYQRHQVHLPGGEHARHQPGHCPRSAARQRRLPRLMG
ncbi:MAG: hypothetical protein WKG07_18435 [Hymenobacter sp.]